MQDLIKFLITKPAPSESVSTMSPRACAMSRSSFCFWALLNIPKPEVSTMTASTT